MRAAFVVALGQRCRKLRSAIQVNEFDSWPCGGTLILECALELQTEPTARRRAGSEPRQVGRCLRTESSADCRVPVELHTYPRISSRSFDRCDD